METPDSVGRAEVRVEVKGEGTDQAVGVEAGAPGQVLERLELERRIDERDHLAPTGCVDRVELGGELLGELVVQHGPHVVDPGLHFGATSDDYLRWLIDELEHTRTTADRPIDIVGHDWGAGHAYRLVDARPDLIRSWAADIGGLLHPDYRWHDAAQAWQTPEVGEQMVEMMVALPVDERVALYTVLGLPSDVATSFAHAVDDDMCRAILALYRSAPEPVLQALAGRLASATLPPGLVITATDDAYVPSELTGPVADSLGADQLVLDGQGHWWMLSDPGAAADGLLAFWSSL